MQIICYTLIANGDIRVKLVGMSSSQKTQIPKIFYASLDEAFFGEVWINAVTWTADATFLIMTSRPPTANEWTKVSREFVDILATKEDVTSFDDEGVELNKLASSNDNSCEKPPAESQDFSPISDSVLCACEKALRESMDEFPHVKAATQRLKEEFGASLDNLSARRKYIKDIAEFLDSKYRRFDDEGESESVGGWVKLAIEKGVLE